METLYDVTCPNCEADFVIDDSDLQEGGIACPECGEYLEFDMDEADEEEDA